jgi:hypothetical protein
MQAANLEPGKYLCVVTDGKRYSALKLLIVTDGKRYSALKLLSLDNSQAVFDIVTYDPLIS